MTETVTMLARNGNRGVSEFLIESSDYDLVCHHQWYMTAAGYVYAVFPSGRFIWLTSLLMKRRVGFVIDHANRRPQDNRRSNLRYLTHTDNMANTAVRRHSKSGIKGVHFHQQSGLWIARISVNRRTLSLGYFREAYEAAATFIVAHRYFHPDLYPGFSDLLQVMFGTRELSWSGRMLRRKRGSDGRFIERYADVF